MFLKICRRTFCRLLFGSLRVKAPTHEDNGIHKRCVFRRPFWIKMFAFQFHLNETLFFFYIFCKRSDVVCFFGALKTVIMAIFYKSISTVILLISNTAISTYPLIPKNIVWTHFLSILVFQLVSS